MNKPISVDSSCQVTILQSDRLACKRITADGIEPYHNGYLFRPHVRGMSGLQDLFGLLTYMGDWPKGYIIRGELRNPRANSIRRKLLGDDATIIPATKGKRWVCLDIDKIETNGSPSLEYLRDNFLPAAFQKPRCVLQWSASAGLDDWKTYRVHLWFWLDRPLCDGALKAWLKPYQVDLSLFHPIQPHYTASPQFDGVEDPLKGQGRVGMLQGVGSQVIVPNHIPSPKEFKKLTEKKEADAAARLERAQRMGADMEVGGRGYGRGALKRSRDRILNAPMGQRHQTLLEEGDGLGELVGSGHLHHVQAVAALAMMVRAIYPQDRWAKAIQAVESAINHGMNNPRQGK